MIAAPAQAQLDFTTLSIRHQYGELRHRHPRRQHDRQLLRPELRGAPGGLLFNLSTGAHRALPVVDLGVSNFPARSAASPTGRASVRRPASCGSAAATRPPHRNPNDLGYLYDGAAVAGAQLTTLRYPGGGTLNTLAHSTFGNQVVGNYDHHPRDRQRLHLRHPDRRLHDNNRPGAGEHHAYGVYGNRIAGGLRRSANARLHLQPRHASLQTYNAPARSLPTSRASPAPVARTPSIWSPISVDALGHPHAWAVHVDSAGIATWTKSPCPARA
jgi:hypothetical protein